MAELTKEMVIAAQRVAFQRAAEKFERNPCSAAFERLETEMYAWQLLWQIDEAKLLALLQQVGIGNWSNAIRKYGFASHAEAKASERREPREA